MAVDICYITSFGSGIFWLQHFMSCLFPKFLNSLVDKCIKNKIISNIVIAEPPIKKPNCPPNSPEIAENNK